MKWGFKWNQTPMQAYGKASTIYNQQVKQQVVMYLTGLQPVVEAWMKQNAPWHDRTGEARRRLYTSVRETPRTVTLVFGQGVDYGLYLETRFQGRDSIIGPTIDHWSPIILRGMKRL